MLLLILLIDAKNKKICSKQKNSAQRKHPVLSGSKDTGITNAYKGKHNKDCCEGDENKQKHRVIIKLAAMLLPFQKMG